MELTEPWLKQSQGVAEKKAQWLLDWKNRLIADLNQKHFSGSFADINGAHYIGIIGGTPERLALKNRDGVVELPWMRLEGRVLLAISASFIRPHASDAADRQWRCAVFANELGQTEVARQFAEAAAKAKAEYRDQISQFFSPAPQSH